MAAEQSFTDQVAELKKTIGALADNVPLQVIETTAQRLEGLNYAPAVITPIKSFLRMDRDALLAEVDRILQLPEAEACALAPGDTRKCEDLRLQFIRAVIYHYEKLLLLRAGNPEEWDEVDELYVHD